MFRSEILAPLLFCHKTKCETTNMRTKNQPVAAPMQQLFLQETRDIKNVVKTMTEILEGELEDCKTVIYYLLHSDTKHKHCIITDEGQEIIISFGSAKKGGSHD